MAACLQGSTEQCREFAKKKSLGPFGSARVACRERRLRKKEVGRLISWVTGLGLFNGSLGFELLAGNQLGLLSELNLSYEVTNFRGSDLLEDRNQNN